jgi:hypothetical protein
MSFEGIVGYCISKSLPRPEERVVTSTPTELDLKIRKVENRLKLQREIAKLEREIAQLKAKKSPA